MADFLQVLMDNANTSLINRQYDSAIACYSEVIEGVESSSELSTSTSTSTTTVEAGSSRMLVMKFRAYSHRAEAYLQMKEVAPTNISTYNTAAAAKDASIALELLTCVPIDGKWENLQSLLDPREVDACRERKERASEMMMMMTMKEERKSSGKDKGANEPSLSLSSKSTVQKDAVKGIASSTTTAKATKEISSSSTKRPAASLTCPKYQYYQNDNFMTIAILEPNVKPQHLRVDFTLDTVNVILQKSSTSFTVVSNTRTLFDAIDVDKCKITYKEEKVLIKLRKRHKHEWHELFGSGASQDDKDKYGDKAKITGEMEIEKDAKVDKIAKSDGVNDVEIPSSDGDSKKSSSDSKPATATTTTTTTTTTTRPYASDKDWNAIDRQLAKEEADDKPEGEEAINNLFQSIYQNADPDTRRAMIKSFQTSGGTCLSTNWNEVEKTDYEDSKHRQAPKGSEWKNWEGDRLPQKDDD